MGSGLKAARQAAGMSQAELAQAAGVSRQAVGAVESGAHRPSVDAALALAAALGRTVEDVFGAAASDVPVAVIGELPDRDGVAVRAARVGDRTVVVELGSDAHDGWPSADAMLARGSLAWLAGSGPEGFVVVGCDPALGLAAALGPRAGEQRIVAAGGPTGAALDALGSGRAHAALVHGPQDALPAPSHPTVRFHLARWRVGLASRHGRRPALEDLLRGGPVVQRDASASVQQAFARALAAVGARAPSGPVASGHLDSARRVAEGARAGLTMEPAALRFGLEFTPLETHTCELWVDARWAGHPGARALGEILSSRAFRERVGALPGYDLTACGDPR